MSRSYKKSPVVTAAKTRGGKRQAARAVRRAKLEGKGGGYKKEYSSWEICDYKSYWLDMTDKYWRK